MLKLHTHTHTLWGHENGILPFNISLLNNSLIIIIIYFFKS